MLETGLITKVNSDTFTVKYQDNYYDCKARGKFRNNHFKPLVGDIVKFNKDKKVIEEVTTRKNVLERPPVANIDIALVVTSLKKPDLNLTLLDKLLSIITIKGITPIIVLTKLDLLSTEELQDITNLFAYYKKIGYLVYTNKEIDALKKALKNKIVTVCGQTGAGKSTLINYFDENLNLATNEISEALGRGKHTTRIVELFEILDFYIVDTPGFSALDLVNYSIEDIQNSFLEFKNYTCKFNDCKHLKEIGCGILDGVDKKEILPSRYNNYVRFIKESSDDRSKLFKK